MSSVDWPNSLGSPVHIGMFQSNSVRGVAILVQRNMMRNPTAELLALRNEWKDSGIRKFREFFYNKNYEYEKSIYRDTDIPYRPTEPQDIQKATIRALSGEKAPIINLIGDWVWTEDRAPELPAVLEERRHLIPDDLEKILEN